MARLTVNSFEINGIERSGTVPEELDISDWELRQPAEGILIFTSTGSGPAEQLTIQPGSAIYEIEIDGSFYAQFEITQYVPRADPAQVFPGNTNVLATLLAESDTLTGNEFDNELNGYARRDWLDGGDGDDILRGGDTGNEPENFLEGGKGADTLIGGRGFNEAVYSNSDAGVTVNLSTGLGYGGEAQGDTLSGIARLRGSDHDDVLIGNDTTNILTGNGGDDQLFGLGGNDNLYGGEGNDLASAGAGNDLVEGGTGHDTLLGDEGTNTLRGGDGNDWIFSGTGADKMDGGDGIDWVSYSNATSGVKVSIREGFDAFNGVDRGAANGDTYTNIENVYGSEFNDLVFGADDGSTIIAGGGKDTILASIGNDFIYGGRGDDNLVGDNGDDFVFGEDGNDFVRGGSGNDWLDGGNGDDVMSGVAGNNIFDDGAGSDEMRGGGGNDTFVIGGGGIDLVSGGAGNDTLVVNTAYETVWFDFQYGDNRIDVSKTGLSKAELKASVVDGGDFIYFGWEDGGELVLSDTALTDFDFDDDVLYGNTAVYDSEDDADLA